MGALGIDLAGAGVPEDELEPVAQQAGLAVAEQQAAPVGFELGLLEAQTIGGRDEDPPVGDDDDRDIGGEAGCDAACLFADRFGLLAQTPLDKMSDDW